MSYGVYVHIPFCRQKCLYCDFPSWAGREDVMEAYTDALCREIESRAADLAARGPAATLYIGGGTPTALPIPLLGRIVETIGARIPFQHEFEFTIEVNPGAIDLEYITALKAMGATRLSIGAQVFNDGLLKRIGRIHTEQDIRDAVRWARAALFVDVSLDLMYGLPGQTMDHLQWSVGSAMDLAVTHISVYGLTIEDGTPFAAAKAKGELGLPSDEETEAMYDYLVDSLPPYGFRRYEISNFARSGFVSRHNLGYWTDVPYAGFGAAAHSYWDGQRTENLRSIDDYVAAMTRGESPSREESPATRKNQMEEFCFLALRTAQGLDTARFEKKFGCPVDRVYAPAIADLKARGLLEEADGFLRLTPPGMKVGNVAFRAFLLDEEPPAPCNQEGSL